MSAAPSPPPVALAVVAWNARDLLAGCLASLEADELAGRAEVWVVDNASEDGSAEMVSERFPRVRLVRSAENLGYGRAVNLVARRTSSPWIAAVNQDVALGADTLARLLRAGEEHPRAGVVVPRLLGPGGEVQHTAHAFPTLALTLAFNLGLGSLSPRLGDRLCLEGRWDPMRPRFVPWAIAALWLVRREAFAAAGGFDEAQWLHAEDVDLAWRMRAAGWGTWHEPAAVAEHAGSVSVRAAFGGTLEERYMAATYAWIGRRMGVSRARAVAAINLAGSAARRLRDPGAARWVAIHRRALTAPRAELLRPR
ncbi:MAG: glycosyltransferase family 2 protein [Thermoleophilaceae bacterium]